MRVIFLLIISVSFISISCKKDKLKDDKEVLIGAWDWKYSTYNYGWCYSQPLSILEIINPDSLNKNYSVEFLKKGKVTFFEDGVETETGRLVFNYFEATSDGKYIFYFYLNNNKELGYAGTINADTLTFDYPLSANDPNCEDYLNFLVRE